MALSRSRKVKSDDAATLSIYDVLVGFNRAFLRYVVLGFQIYMSFHLSFHGHSRSDLWVWWTPRDLFPVSVTIPGNNSPKFTSFWDIKF